MDVRKEALALGFDQAEALPASLFPAAEDILPGGRTLWILVTAHRPYAPGDWPEDCLAVSSHYPASQAAYHRVRKLAAMLEDAGYRAAAHPMLPAKRAAEMAGIGWMGRQELLHHPEYGTYICLHLLLTEKDENASVRPVMPAPCGECHACVDACPTGAVLGTGRIDPSRCIRSYMLEAEPMPDAMIPHLGHRLVGCDACQLACPHNAPVGFAPIPGSLRDALRLRGVGEEEMREKVRILADMLGKNLIRPARVRNACALCEESMRRNDS